VTVPSGSPARRGPPAVAWVLVLAVLVGVAAALLSRPIGPPGPSGPSYGPLSWNHWGELLGILALLGIGVWLFLLLRNRSNRAPIPERIVATILVVLLLGVLFVELAGFVHVGPPPNSGNSSGSGGGSSGTHNGTGNNNATLFGTPSVPLPGWVGIAAVLGIALVACVLVVPYAIHRVEDRRRARTEAAAPAGEVEEALRDALTRLRSTNESDARAAILELYSRLLRLVGPRIGDLESRTPREIEQESIAALGLRAAVALDLRETFEEARYSTHPMGADALGRAREAIGAARADLARRASAR
jgi:hypothetical protein